jgi:hypothetical protein
MKKWFSEDVARKVASHAFAWFAGCAVGSGIGLYSLGKYQKRVNDRHKKIADAFDEIDAIMNDVTLSADEREKKAQELSDCALMLMREDLF